MATLDVGLKILGELETNALSLEILLDHLDRLVPFVGAGLSFDFGYPSWTELLEDLADQAGLRDRVDSLLANYQFEEAAEELSTSLSNLFDATLRRIFGDRKLPRPLSKGAVRHVPRIARGPVLTTNFDRVLEAAFEDAGCRFRQVLPGPRIREAHQALQLGDPFLLKLHGDYFYSESRVLTLQEYTREYGNPDPEKIDFKLPLPSVIDQALGGYPLLFLGCSLKNDRTTRVIAQIAMKPERVGTVHFALLPASDSGLDRRKQLDAWHIFPVFFRTGEFERIDQFLRFLADAVARRPGG